MLILAVKAEARFSGIYSDSGDEKEAERAAAEADDLLQRMWFVESLVFACRR